MKNPRAESVHLVALSLWLGALLAVGGIAAVAFPTMKALAPALPGFKVPMADHWSIAAGHVMNPAFFAAMIGGIVLGPVSLAAWGSMGGVRRVLALAAVGLAAAALLGLGLPMRGHLDAYWGAARAGEMESAAAAKERFDALHPWSSRALAAQAGLVGTCIVLGVVTRGSAKGRSE